MGEIVPETPIIKGTNSNSANKRQCRIPAQLKPIS